MEPKPETTVVDKYTHEIELGISPFREVFEVLAYRCHRDEKGFPRCRTHHVHGHGELLA